MDLTPFNTFKLVSRAQAYVRITTSAQLPELFKLATRYASFFVLGGGSNVVLPEQVPGLVVHMQIRGVHLREARPDAWVVEAGGGENWHECVQTCQRKGWYGLENLALIPGTVGAAPVQNIGAYGLELAQRFESLTAWDRTTGESVEMSAEDCRFAYRDSRFKHDIPGRWLILAVRFALPRPWRPNLSYGALREYLIAHSTEASVTARIIFDAVCAIRREKLPDPALMGNVGSFFKNPVVSGSDYRALQARFPGVVGYIQQEGRYKLAAAWLIEQCGWKGRTLGQVGVHPRHALVLVNQGGASITAVLALADAIRRDVQARFGVSLEQEPMLLGQTLIH